MTLHLVSAPATQAELHYGFLNTAKKILDLVLDETPDSENRLLVLLDEAIIHVERAQKELR